MTNAELDDLRRSTLANVGQMFDDMRAMLAAESATGVPAAELELFSRPLTQLAADVKAAAVGVAELRKFVAQLSPEHAAILQVAPGGN